MKRSLFYISENYSFEILRPLQKEILARGGEVKWFVSGNNVNLDDFCDNEVILNLIEEAVRYKPEVCFIPGNHIPSFIPGIKVQIFHGLEWKKKGHFQIRGCFDLYCTHGKSTTFRFKLLAQKHRYFDVIETGWPKVDPLFNTLPRKHFSIDKPTILYAPTFSPKLTSASNLFNEIKVLSQSKKYNWLIKFHPKMPFHWVEQYSKLECEHIKVVNSCEINELFQSADILLSDTSSVIGEFSLLGKSIVTYNNSLPGDYLIDIKTPDKLSIAILAALSPTVQLKQAITNYCEEIHPYKDGQSSYRIMDAVENILAKGKLAKKRKPLNIFRNFKLRMKFNYWKI
ncbi:MAG: CDP-glycerol glycerophosphotransferase (TagB/SpsB family) [Psychroserpens sp.]|jgi:CDP-glycerol glycerophosphotransferase (TagB/SpsB family)